MRTDRKSNHWIHLNRNIIRVLTGVGLVLTLFLAMYIYRIGYEELMENIRYFLVRIGMWGPLLFIVLQLVMVVYPVIPGGITLVVGQLIFGPLLGFIYSFIAVTGGSILNFLLAKRFGKTFARAFVEEKTYQKYYVWLTKGKHFEYFLAIAFALPGFPDDFLCMIAGLTKMSFKRFLVIYLIFKPVTLYLYGAGGATLTNWFMQNFFPFGY